MVKRALIPGHVLNANMWYELGDLVYCSACNARPEKVKKCPCSAERYCNSECQRKHWKRGHKKDHAALTRRRRRKTEGMHVDWMKWINM
jgi:hypothetical protein